MNKSQGHTKKRGQRKADTLYFKLLFIAKYAEKFIWNI